ncbi:MULTISPECIES: NAD-dependent malic enzyme [Streptomyces]|uniref:NAD-dependent malic enzyme 2 n=2 Tax=Streptomyces rimosus subsp. rimosus TaxID=132474 RepID=A0ABY3Z7E7_STRRM|nr:MULTISPECIES: NAD-dependent malic enzyme [Streptomyces]KOG71011.1 malate dehydrogenase [Kitasatospora aureofaciens]MYT47831.1 oxaloacetate-decarboxylating malate dehydrogenase [Streptomyces sp. SID5471]KEF03296.1 malate dehydrogenase [Streptomyces rimosus]KOT34156.1 malate dehydrogenase [Streptomyces rimosus subsp. rimosus]KOT34881.1 malate dehydrogenase [Streptomyces sp. NRRL WC-3701]
MGRQPRLPSVMSDPLTNRGTAFTAAERDRLGLVGRLPDAVLTLDQQARRAYEQLRRQPDDLAAYINLEQLHDRNEVLYYRLLTDHLTELLPIVYDPTVGEAIKTYSHEYRRPRGVFLSIDRPRDLRRSFEELELGADEVDLVVVTDAEQILGIGDWGVHGIQISVGKLAVYTAAAGIDPARCLAVVLDVGTDNETLLNDPLYLGVRHSRARGERYDAFVAAYLDTVSELYPDALLHFEDFGAGNARRFLERYGERYRMFNDDMQGTGAITLAAVRSALNVTGSRFGEQRVVVFGAGTAGVGIADQLREAMVRDGLDKDEATRRFWLVDRPGLLLDDMDGLRDYQRGYARPKGEVEDWAGGADRAGGDTGHAADQGIDLLTTVRNVRPTVLIGTSTVRGAFTRQVVEEMAQHVERPVIFPLSNPTEKIEAMPADLLRWTGGRALTTAGIPVDPVEVEGVRHVIGQANNALVYPGLGLGVVVSRAERLTPGMLLAAAEAVAGQVEGGGPGAPLLPQVENLRASSAAVAVAVVRAAVEEGVARVAPDDVVQAVQDAMWQPVYGETPRSSG